MTTGSTIHKLIYILYSDISKGNMFTNFMKQWAFMKILNLKYLLKHLRINIHTCVCAHACVCVIASNPGYYQQSHHCHESDAEVKH